MDITEKVLKAYSNIENQRLKSSVSLLIKHLHACVKEMKPTSEIWLAGHEKLAAIVGV
jgi:Catechol dioxygenase N terminus